LGVILLRGRKETSLLPLLSKGENIILKRGFYFVFINAKGGECWTWCYGVGIDVKEG